MSQEILIVVARIGAAVVIGGIIGLERSFRGRPAGFRTHALVCIASALLMLVTVYQGEWMTAVPTEAIRTDPTRMAQGIMTGIGFLGAVPRSWWTADLVLSVSIREHLESLELVVISLAAFRLGGSR